MSARGRVERDFLITVYQDGESPAAIRVEFVPRGLQAVREPGKATRRVPTFLVRARLEGKTTVTEWENPPPHAKADRDIMEKEAAERLAARLRWLERLQHLLDEVETWARDLGWETRRVRKELRDAQIGAYQTRALLLQQETARVLVEPVGSSAPGAEGVVDLYLLPAYDDVASLYHYDGRWHLHSLTPGAPFVGNIREAESRPLSKMTLRKVLDEMRRNVAEA
jgi:hypothetical protein